MPASGRARHKPSAVRMCIGQRHAGPVKQTSRGGGGCGRGWRGCVRGARLLACRVFAGRVHVAARVRTRACVSVRAWARARVCPAKKQQSKTGQRQPSRQDCKTSERSSKQNGGELLGEAGQQPVKAGVPCLACPVQKAVSKTVGGGAAWGSSGLWWHDACCAPSPTFAQACTRDRTRDISLAAKRCRRRTAQPLQGGAARPRGRPGGSGAAPLQRIQLTG